MSKFILSFLLLLFAVVWLLPGTNEPRILLAATTNDHALLIRILASCLVGLIGFFLWKNRRKD